MNAYSPSISHTVPVQRFSQDQLAQPDAPTPQASDDIWQQQVCWNLLATVLPCLTPNINQGCLSGRIFQTSWQSFTGCYANTLSKSNCSTQCAYVPTIRLSTSTLKWRWNLICLPWLIPIINKGLLSGRLFQTSSLSYTECYANTLPRSSCSTQRAYVPPAFRLSTSTLRFVEENYHTDLCQTQ